MAGGRRGTGLGGLRCRSGQDVGRKRESGDEWDEHLERAQKR